MKLLHQFIMLLLLSHSIFGEYSIHVLSPWRDDTIASRRDSLYMQGNGEVGYYPGTKMISEGGGWFYYTYETISKTSRADFKITCIGPQSWDVITYPHTFPIDTIFSLFPPSIEDLWIVMDPDTTKPPVIDTIPPHAKVINILNPWPENSPKIVMNSGSSLQMRVREDLCGWYRYYYAGPLDSLYNIFFTDYYEKNKYTSAGLTNGPGINLQTILSTKDTVYILPKPFPVGSPSLTNAFPGRLGDCNTRQVSGIFRDWSFDSKSFFNQPMGASSGGKGMVLKTLTAPDYKPKIDPASTVSNIPPLETWYVTKTFADGTNNDTCINMTMIKGYDGRWTFDSDKMGGFFPLDNFNDSNNFKYKDDIGKMRNFHFTMEMHMQFIYHEGLGLEFDFKGDDDVFIYVNNRLAIDLGGLNWNAKDTLFLDKKKDELQIVDGQTYNMDIFYAERNPTGSNLFIKTSMDLRNSSELYYKEKSIGTGITQYEIWQQKKTQENDCGLTRLTDGEELASVDFYISGPQFDDTVKLSSGLHFGGIMVDPANSRVTLDSAKLSGLKAGDYQILFVSTIDKNRSGYLLFTIQPIPDHLDVMPDSLSPDLNHDVKIDSLVLGEEQDSLLLFAVIRDIDNVYLEAGRNCTWKSSNEKSLTITPSTNDKAHAMIKKVDEGSAWIIVSQNGLKPDSVLVHAEAKANWPFISSAVMSDSHGDLVPDLIHITLTDTFKSDQKLTSVEITYRDKQYSIPSVSCQIIGTTLTVPFTSTTGIDAKPVGTVKIKMDIKNKEKSSTRPFTDGVGPSLIYAEILEKEDNEPDLLFLYFSEAIKQSSLIGDQLLLLKDGSSDTVHLKISRTNKMINDSSFSVSLAVSNSTIQPGDKLRLVPAVMSGTISDAGDNKPHLLNKPVIIALKKGAASILKAWYKDGNANGTIDSLMIHYKRHVEISEFDSISIQWNLTLHKVSPDNFRAAGDSLIAISLKGAVISSDEIITGGSMFLSQKFKSTSTLRTATVIDSAAPVISSARLLLGGYDDNWNKFADTLSLVFSEIIHSTDVAPCSLSNSSNSSRYRFITSSKDVTGKNCRFIIDNYEPSNSHPERADSIWINVNAEVSDEGGVSQKSLLNRRVLLDIVQPPAIWIFKVGPNPVTIPNEEVILWVASKKNIDLRPFNATVNIYDALGNTVSRSTMTNNGKSLMYTWNGRNSKGRLVGEGTYLAYVSIYENGAVIWNNTKALGIKRSKK